MPLLSRYDGATDTSRSSSHPDGHIDPLATNNQQQEEPNSAPFAGQAHAELECMPINLRYEERGAEIVRQILSSGCSAEEQLLRLGNARQDPTLTRNDHHTIMMKRTTLIEKTLTHLQATHQQPSHPQQQTKRILPAQFPPQFQPQSLLTTLHSQQYSPTTYTTTPTTALPTNPPSSPAKHPPPYPYPPATSSAESATNSHSAPPTQTQATLPIIAPRKPPYTPKYSAYGTRSLSSGSR